MKMNMKMKKDHIATTQIDVGLDGIETLYPEIRDLRILRPGALGHWHPGPWNWDPGTWDCDKQDPATAFFYFGTCVPDT